MVSTVYSEDGAVNSEHPLHKLYALIEGSFATVYGWNLQIPNQLPGLLRELGFVNVSQKRNEIPLGRWHRDAKMREMGLFSQIIQAEWLPNMFVKHDALGITADEAQRLEKEILDAFDDCHLRTYQIWMDCWAQKPLG
jgi:hypothetical protein